MGIMKQVLDVLFGKDPQIFDENGKVRHKVPEKKWQDWDSRFKSSAYDWHGHRGTERGHKTSGPKKS